MTLFLKRVFYRIAKAKNLKRFCLYFIFLVFSSSKIFASPVFLLTFDVILKFGDKIPRLRNVHLNDNSVEADFLEFSIKTNLLN